MTQKSVKIFINEIYSQGPEKIYNTIEKDVYHIDNIWTLNILDLKVYGPENKRSCRCVLVLIDRISNFGWAVAIRNKDAITLKNNLQKILLNSKRKQNLGESDQRTELYKNIFRNFLNNTNFKHYSRNTSFGDVFAERFNRTIRDLPKRPLCEKVESNWVDNLPKITKPNNIPVHTSTKLTPIQYSLKKNGGFVNKNVLDKPKIKKPKFQVNDLVRVADLRKVFSKGETTNWSNKLYKTTKNFNDTLPGFHIDNLKERYNESLLKKTELSMTENQAVMEALYLN